MLWLLSNRYCFPSARILRDSLQNHFKETIRVTTHSNRNFNNDLLVRFGNPDRIPGEDTEFNSPEFIRNCTNKREMSDLLNSHDFNVPLFYRLTPPTTFPVLIRTTLYSRGGNGIIICNNIEEFNSNWQPSYYWTKYVRMSSELRVHIFNGKILRIYKKVREDGRDLEEIPIRNSHNGYHFSLINNIENGYARLKEIARDLPFKNYFCGMDAGWCPEIGDYFILELNSAPGLTINTANLYAEKIYNYFNRGE